MKRFTTFFGLMLTGLVCGVVLSAALGSARATAWTPNASDAPQNNVESLLHVGAADQEKGTGATCSTAGSACGLAVGSFLASKNAAFDGEAFFHQLITGGEPAGTLSSTLSFGDDASAVALSVSGNGFVNGGGLYSNKIITAGTAPLCADKSGTIVLCSNAPVIPPPPQTILGKITWWADGFKSKKDFHGGSAHLRIDFSNPLPTEVKIQYAYCDNNKYADSSLSNVCYGTAPLGISLPAGYIAGGTQTGTAMTIDIPPGTSSYTVPVQLGYTWNGSRKKPHTSYLSYLYFKQVIPDAASGTVSFIGTAYSANKSSSYGTAFPITITRIP